MGHFFHIIATSFIRPQLVLLFLHCSLRLRWRWGMDAACVVRLTMLSVFIQNFTSTETTRVQGEEVFVVFGPYLRAICLSEGGGKSEWCVCPRVALVPSHWRHAADTPGGISRELPKAWWDNNCWTLFLSLLYNGHQRTLMLLADHCLGAVHPGICLQRAGRMQGTEVKKERCRTYKRCVSIYIYYICQYGILMLFCIDFYRCTVYNAILQAGPVQNVAMHGKNHGNHGYPIIFKSFSKVSLTPRGQRKANLASIAWSSVPYPSRSTWDLNRFKSQIERPEVKHQHQLGMGSQGRSGEMKFGYVTFRMVLQCCFKLHGCLIVA